MVYLVGKLFRRIMIVLTSIQRHSRRSAHGRWF